MQTTAELNVTDRLQIAVDNARLQIKINELPPTDSKIISLDIEHDERGNFVCVGIYCGDLNVAYILFDLDLVRLFNFRSVYVIAHNGVSDLSVMKTWGLDVPAVPSFDTQLTAHIVDSSLKTYGLKDMAKRELGIEYPDYDEIVGKHKGKTKKAAACPKLSNECCERVTLDKQPRELVSLYNALDVYCTYKLYEKLAPYVESYWTYYTEFEQPLALVLDKMEARGVRINTSELKSLLTDLKCSQEHISKEIMNELGPINLNSPKQLLEALHSKGLSPTLKGKPSTDKRAIGSIEHPITKSLLAYSELETLLSSFIYPYLQRQTSVVHPFFNQTGTRTGRLSCSNPNLLQIPRRTENGRKVRGLFIPRLGFTMGDTDYGQIEPRLLAHLSKDPNMISMFQTGVDFHTFTSEKLGITRDKAKVLNLSVGYRATFKSVSAQLDCSESEAQVEIDKWWSLFPALRRWQDQLIWATKRSGYFTTLLGRRIKVDNLNIANKWQRETAVRRLINNIAQSSAREVMAKAMLRIDSDQRLSSSFGLLVQVYDELLFESAFMEHDFPLVVDDMVNAVKLEVPLIVDGKTGLNWSVCH